MQWQRHPGKAQGLCIPHSYAGRGGGVDQRRSRVYVFSATRHPGQIKIPLNYHHHLHVLME